MKLIYQQLPVRITYLLIEVISVIPNSKEDDSCAYPIEDLYAVRFK
jgi:hypothetical protein